MSDARRESRSSIAVADHVQCFGLRGIRVNRPRENSHRGPVHQRERRFRDRLAGMGGQERALDERHARAQPGGAIALSSSAVPPR